jgi:hypothetical protein
MIRTHRGNHVEAVVSSNVRLQESAALSVRLRFMPLELDLRMFRQPSMAVKFCKERKTPTVAYAPFGLTGDLRHALGCSHTSVFRPLLDRKSISHLAAKSERRIMGTKQRIQKIEEAWQKKAAAEKKSIVEVKCQPAGKVERVRGIMV